MHKNETVIFTGLSFYGNGHNFLEGIQEGQLWWFTSFVWIYSWCCGASSWKMVIVYYIHSNSTTRFAQLKWTTVLAISSYNNNLLSFYYSSSSTSSISKYTCYYHYSYYIIIRILFLFIYQYYFYISKRSEKFQQWRAE